MDSCLSDIYTLSLHDALPISGRFARGAGELRQLGLRRRDEHVPLGGALRARLVDELREHRGDADRKSTRLNSSHLGISYAVFCLKKKTYPTQQIHLRT